MAEFIKTSFDDGGFTFFLQNIKGGKLKTALKSGLSLRKIRFRGFPVPEKRSVMSGNTISSGSSD